MFFGGHGVLTYAQTKLQTKAWFRDLLCHQARNMDQAYSTAPRTYSVHGNTIHENDKAELTGLEWYLVISTSPLAHSSRISWILCQTFRTLHHRRNGWKHAQHCTVQWTIITAEFNTNRNISLCLRAKILNTPSELWNTHRDSHKDIDQAQSISSIVKTKLMISSS